MAVMVTEAPLAGARPLAEIPAVKPSLAEAAENEPSASHIGDRVAFAVWKFGVVLMAAMLLWNLLCALARF